MPDSLLKKSIDAVWPRGSSWSQKIGGGMEGLLLGIADSLELVRGNLGTLALLRNPESTEQLDELEIDFGITPDQTLTEAVRRARLDARINAEQTAGTRDRMEREIQAAGFDLFVHANNPAVNPLQFTSSFQMVAGGVDAFAGEPGAVAGVFTAEILVNGAFVRTVAVWNTVAGGDEAFAGEPTAIAEQVGTINLPFEYAVPTDPADWPLVFFVGGPATRDGSGALIAIDIALVPVLRRAELERTVLRLKPLHSWAMMMVEYNS